MSAHPRISLPRWRYVIATALVLTLASANFVLADDNNNNKDKPGLKRTLVSIVDAITGSGARVDPNGSLSVNVANLPLDAAGNVKTTSTTTVTFPVTQAVVDAGAQAKIDRLNAALQPFTFAGGGVWVGTAPNQSSSFVVPTGKRLVIEQVSADAEVTLTASQKVSVIVATQTGGVGTNYWFGANDFGQTGIWEHFVGSSQLRSYADAGTGVTVYVRRNDTSVPSSIVSVFVSGYLVNVP